jgi:hypothetical protein
VIVADPLQCPRCELRFTSSAERKWHLDHDHPGAIEEHREYDPVTIEDPPEPGQAPPPL